MTWDLVIDFFLRRISLLLGILIFLPWVYYISEKSSRTLVKTEVEFGLKALPSHNASDLQEFRRNAAFHTLELPADLLDCDLWTGTWIYDRSYPNRSSGSCKIGKSHNSDCDSSTKATEDYLHYRWKPNECELPRFDSYNFLRIMKGKKILFVGDSLSLNHHASLVCLLESSSSFDRTTRMKSCLDVHSNHCEIRFLEHNLTITFRRSNYLVLETTSNHSTKYTSILNTTEIDSVYINDFLDSDLVILNTGAWFHQRSLPEGMFIYGNVSDMDVEVALKTSISTALNWIDTVNLTNKVVIYRSLTPMHFSSTNASCYMSQPSKDPMGIEYYFLRLFILSTISKLKNKNHIMHLDIEFLSSLRPDAHPNTLNRHKNSAYYDCIHWCLPGIPDTWNDLMYVQILKSLKKRKLKW